MTRATRRARKAIARAERAVADERQRLVDHAEALREGMREQVATLRARIAERERLAGPTRAEQSDARRDREALESDMRELASATVARLRGIEAACARLAARRKDLTAAGSRLDRACGRLVRERRLATWHRALGKRVRLQPLAEVSAMVDEAVGIAEASVARSNEVLGRQEAKYRRDADALTLARNGSLPDLDESTASEEFFGRGASREAGQADISSLDADAWDELRATAHREAARLPRDDKAFLAWVDNAGPRSKRPAKPTMGVGAAVFVGLLGAAALLVGAVLLRAHLAESEPAAPSSPQSVEVPKAKNLPVAASKPARREPVAEAVAKVVEVAPAPAPEPTPEPTPEPLPTPTESKAPKAKAHPRVTEAQRVNALRVAVERRPRSPWPRLKLASKLEAEGNPMGAVRHLDYLRTLGTDDARRAIERAKRDPGLAPWVATRWWSAFSTDPTPP